MKNNFVDDRQKLLIEDYNEIIPGPFNTMNDILEELNERNIDNDLLYKIHVWTKDEEQTVDISEDLAEAWIKDRDATINEFIIDDMCPIYVLNSRAWENYKHDAGI